MYPGDSEVRQASGFSLLEVVVALAISGILLWIAVRFYKDSYRTYNLQEQLADRDQNAYYTVKKLTEVLQQAGSGLPDTGYAVVTPLGSSPHTGVAVGYNPRGGAHFVVQATTSATSRLPVGDTTSFKGATHVLIDYADPGTATVKKTVSSLVAGQNATDPDTVVVATPGVDLAVGDMIYAYKEDTVTRVNDTLTIGGITMAENIDSLKFFFYRADMAATTSWALMRSAQIRVSARTPRPDPHLPGDGYRRIPLSMSVLFRNKI